MFWGAAGAKLCLPCIAVPSCVAVADAAVSMAEPGGRGAQL